MTEELPDVPAVEANSYGITAQHVAKVMHIVLNHDRAMDDQREEMTETCAIYETEWVKYNYGQIAGYKRNGTEIEVNRLHKGARAYLGALYPRSPRVVCEADPRDRGDAQVTQTALNDWWKKPYGYLTVDHASMMAYTLPGSGFKVGYDPGDANPIERTWMRAIPPWEMVLDRDAPSYEDERYRGHIYQSPIEEVVERYPQLAGKLKGGLRRDFFEQATAGNPVVTSSETNPAAVGEYVRVFEFLNLRDPYTADSGECYRGRLEVYILDQAADVSGKPVVVTPLPFQDADGRDIPNIEPLIFDHKIGYPLRPLPPAKIMIPQQTELNRLRTAMAQDVRRDARKFLYREGTIAQDAFDKLNNGIDMQGVAITDPTTSLTDIVRFLENPPSSSNTVRYTQQVENDLDRASGPSQNAQGIAIDTTAYEAEVIQIGVEESVKYHMLRLYGTLARVTKLVQCAIRQAGKDSGDSEGGSEPTAKKPKIGAFQEFTLKDGEERLTVTGEALNGDFPLTFVDADNTPVNRQTMLQFMTGPGLVQYQGLWALVEKGGATGMLAERAMQHIAEAMNLPKDMHPSAMKATLKKEAAEVEKVKGPPKGVGAAMAPPPAPPPEPPPQSSLVDTLTGALTALGQLASQSPEARQALTPAAQALQVAIRAAGDEDAAGVAEALGVALDALPPGSAPEVEQVLSAVLGSLSGAEPPAESPAV